MAQPVVSQLGAQLGGSAQPVKPVAPINPNTAAIQAARGAIGTPYSWGGGGTSGASYGTAQGSGIKGFDCSSLLQYSFGKAGVPIARTTYQQYQQGTPVPEHDLQPGDAVFFEPTHAGPGHVALYIGSGKVIAAPHTGSTVQVQSLADVSSMDGYVGARRYAGGGAAVTHAIGQLGVPAETQPKPTDPVLAQLHQPAAQQNPVAAALTTHAAAAPHPNALLALARSLLA